MLHSQFIEIHHSPQGGAEVPRPHFYQTRPRISRGTKLMERFVFVTLGLWRLLAIERDTGDTLPVLCLHDVTAPHYGHIFLLASQSAMTKQNPSCVEFCESIFSIFTHQVGVLEVKYFSPPRWVPGLVSPPSGPKFPMFPVPPLAGHGSL